METEETVKEECVAMSKTKRIWLAFVDIVLFTVLFMIFLFLFAIPFAIAFPELKTQAGGMSVYLMMLNEVLMLASGLIAACMVLGFRKLPFSGLGLSLKGWGRSLLNGALFVVFLYVVGFGLSLLLGAMELPGIVGNITNFGAFVDIGIKENGLVHLSQLADRFISDPNEVVSIHQHIRVKVLSIDMDRKRIQLTMKGVEQN